MQVEWFPGGGHSERWWGYSNSTYSYRICLNVNMFNHVWHVRDTALYTSGESVQKGDRPGPCRYGLWGAYRGGKARALYMVPLYSPLPRYPNDREIRQAVKNITRTDIRLKACLDLLSKSLFCEQHNPFNITCK